MTYKPDFKITNSLVQFLGKIDAAKEIVEQFPLPLVLEKKFQQEAAIKISHFSTKIEGNRLTLKQTKELLEGKEILGREKDKREVLNYYRCLEWIQKNAKKKKRISEKEVKQLHSIIQKGIVTGKLRGEYREAQNVIYDAASHKITFFPPEAKEVPHLIRSLLDWYNKKPDLHPALIAGIFHYQFVTIHPFMDGNGRTARALATFILYQNGYALKKLYSLEEFYSEELSNYYQALHTCQGLHFYDGPNPDITSWLAYFVQGVAIVFEELKNKIVEASKKGFKVPTPKEIKLLESIGPREKKLLSFFHKNYQLRTQNVCSLFQVKERTARDLIQKWLHQKLIEKQGNNKNRCYTLSAVYRRLINQ